MKKTIFTAACELKNKLRTALFAAVLMTFSTAYVVAQEHPPSAVPAPGAEDIHQADGQHVAEAGEHHDRSIGGMIKGMMWPVANFIIFLGVIYYFANKPLADYLAGRSTTIRKDLVDAAELKAMATAQLAAIEQKLQALPAELDKLRARGAEDIKAEEARIAAAATADRERLLEQTRREIELQVRLAKKEILEHAADLSVQLATDRIKQEVTPEDQARLVDRYLDQVKQS